MSTFLHTPQTLTAPRTPRRTRKRVRFTITLDMVRPIAEAESREFIERTA